VPEPRPGRDSDLMRSDLRIEGQGSRDTAYGERGTAQGVCVCVSSPTCSGMAPQPRRGQLRWVWLVCVCTRLPCVCVDNRQHAYKHVDTHTHETRPERTVRVHATSAPEYIPVRDQLSGRIDSPRTSESHSEAVSNT